MTIDNSCWSLKSANRSVDTTTFKSRQYTSSSILTCMDQCYCTIMNHDSGERTLSRCIVPIVGSLIYLLTKYVSVLRWTTLVRTTPFSFSTCCAFCTSCNRGSSNAGLGLWDGGLNTSNIPAPATPGASELTFRSIVKRRNVSSRPATIATTTFLMPVIFILLRGAAAFVRSQHPLSRL